MINHYLVRFQVIPKSKQELFPFFAEAANLERITPNDMKFQILTPGPIEMRAGMLIEYKIKLFGIPMHWLTEITHWDPPNQFIDIQLKGPYAQWVHRHVFIEQPDGSTRMEDHVRFRLPLSPLGELAAPLVHLQLKHIFDYRQEVIRELLL